MSDVSAYMRLKANDSRDHAVNGATVTEAMSEHLNENVEEKNCWICLEVEISDKRDGWLKPCKCIGSSKWVHTGCLNRWLFELQKNHPDQPLRCTQCHTEYLIVYSPQGKLEKIYDILDKKWGTLASYVCIGTGFLCVYWSSMTFGAVTLYQLVGLQQGQHFLRSSSGLFYLLGLPLIPIALITFNSINWEQNLMRILHRSNLLRNFLNIFEYVQPLPDAPPPPRRVERNVQRILYVGSDTFARNLCIGLILPTASSVVGNIFFRGIQSTFQRTLLGGFVFITFQGVCKLYLLEQLIKRYNERRVLHHQTATENIQAEL